MEELRKAIQSGRVIIADGAMGTMLQRNCDFNYTCLESLNISHPKIVLGISRQYVAAGAELIQTNTFGASPINLAKYGLETKTEELNRAAVKLAREAADGKAWVTSSIGPCGRQLKPFGYLSADEFKESCKRQVFALADTGVDAFSIETMMDVEEAVLAIRVAKEIAPEAVVMVSATFSKTPNDYFTPFGNSIAEFVSRSTEAGADVVGSNCGTGMAQMIEIARIMQSHTDLPILIRPNAGLPELIDGKPVWRETPEDFARGAEELLTIDVNIIGGCCGTTPEHIMRFVSTLGVRSQSRKGGSENTKSQHAESRPDTTCKAISPPRSAGGNKKGGN